MPATAVRRDIDSSDPAPTLSDTPHTAGVAAYARALFKGESLQPTWDALMARATATPPDAGAMLDLSTLLQLAGERDQGLALQADALARHRRYRRVVGTGQGPRLLALVAAGDLMASTPVDFLLRGWNGVLDLMFVAPGEQATIAIPDHDVALIAVGQSDANATLLDALAAAAATWPKPMLNGAVGAVRDLGRDRAPACLAGVPGLDAPPTLRLTRAQLAVLGLGGIPLGDILPGRRFPVLLRPVDSHAGAGLEKLEACAEIAGYLARQPGELFYLTPFVDYAGPDGRYRKLRVALVDGRPFLAHMAVSDHWMVHYLNAGMAESADKRAEEAAMMVAFEADFASRHARAFAAVHAAFGLDYLALDCAEDRDGRLLVFEADTAMIVHDMDPPDLYPYKGPAMRRLMAAFQAMVADRAGPRAGTGYLSLRS